MYDANAPHRPTGSLAASRERRWDAMSWVVYFAQDLADAAVARRIRMLRAGGAEVRLFGFHRSEPPVREVEGVAAVDLGRTFDGRLANRIAVVARCSLSAQRMEADIRWADALLARNLDMATIADAARIWTFSRVRLVYECLDIHGAVSGRRVSSKLLRSWERHILRRSAALIVSSDAFIAHHFTTLGVELPSVIVAENKRVLLEERATRPKLKSLDGPPWKIGWFGNLRCARSFSILLALARRHPKLIEIELRGLPTYDVQGLIAQHLPQTNMRFSGPYVQSDLASMYQSCHLTWGIDYWQQGANSDWLLPNRLYEGGYYNCPVIALAQTETACWLEKRGAGLIVSDPDVELDALIANMASPRYLELQRSAAAIPTDDLVYTPEDCRRFAARVTGS